MTKLPTTSPAASAAGDFASPDDGNTALRETVVERSAKWIGVAVLLLTLTLTLTEILMRTLLGFSWPGTVEYGGYAVVAMTFMGLPVALMRGEMHQMQMVRNRLGPRALAAFDTFLNVIALLFMCVLLWQFSRLVITSWSTGDTSMTTVRTPLWMPRAFMVLGAGAACYVLLRFIADRMMKFVSSPRSGE